MTNRREFIKYSGVAALLAAAPMQAYSQERKLPRRPIPGTDESMPIIGLGNSRSFRADDLDLASNLLDIFLEHGGGYVDVGGSSAFSVGKLAQQKNATDKLFLGTYVDPKDARIMRQEVLTTAKAQGKPALDLVHTRDLAGYRAQHEKYLALKEEGKVRYLGVARSGRQNFDSMAQLIESGLVDFVQVNYSLVEPEAAERVLPIAAEKGVAVVVNRPFQNGNFFSMIRGKELPAWAADFDCATWAQFSLKFILAHPAVNCVLTETANPDHAIDNLGAGFGRLPNEQEQAKMLDVIRSL
jgi:aryl-alcohol dehydrogenase-like predicted oxidoreductase